MARIRSIKPEFFTSEQIVECSTSARLLFVGLWCFCDDGGVHPASLKRLKMEVFPGDAITDAQIGALVDELIDNGLLIEFQAGNELFWHVPKWEKHQKIDRPTFKYPRPDDKNSTIIRRVLDECSTSPRDGTERNGTEWNGVNTEEGTGNSKKEIPQASLMAFPLKDGSTWTLSSDKFSEYQTAFPKLDVEAELKHARQWCQDNPAKRKTASGMSRFLTSWLGNQKTNPTHRQTHEDQPEPHETKKTMVLSSAGENALNAKSRSVNKNVRNSQKAGSTLAAVDLSMLRDTRKLMDWFESQEAIPCSHENRVWILAAAEQAVAEGNNPAAWFVDLVKEVASGKQTKFKDTFYDRGKLRLKEWNARNQIDHQCDDQSRGPFTIGELLPGVAK